MIEHFGCPKSSCFEKLFALCAKQPAIYCSKPALEFRLVEAQRISEQFGCLQPSYIKQKAPLAPSGTI